LRKLGSDDRSIDEEYRLALHLARQQGALALELRAGTDFASWLAQTNRRKQGELSGILCAGP